MVEKKAKPEVKEKKATKSEPEMEMVRVGRDALGIWKWELKPKK